MKKFAVVLFISFSHGAPLFSDDKTSLSSGTPASVATLAVLKDHSQVTQLLASNAGGLEPFGKGNLTDEDGILIRGGSHQYARWLPLNFVRFQDSKEEIPLNVTNLISAITDGLKFIKPRMWLSKEEFDIGCVPKADGTIDQACAVGEKMSLFSDFPPHGFAGMSPPHMTAIKAGLPDKGPTFNAPYKTCIVVGNSGILQRQKLGAKIDNEFEAVFRVDDAPIKPAEVYAPDVGTKTTFRFVNYLANDTNPEITADDADARGTPHPEGKSGTVLVCQTETCMAEAIPKAAKMGYHIIHPYWYKITFLHPLEGKVGLPSLGLVAITTATQMCDDISYVGFQPGPLDKATGKACEAYFDCSAEKLRTGPERSSANTTYNPRPYCQVQNETTDAILGGPQKYLCERSQKEVAKEAQILSLLPDNLKFKFSNLDTALAANPKQ